MTVDVIILTYNRAEEIGATLDNVLQHTVALRKVIVVDNASTDGTERVLARYASHPQVQILRAETNLGCPGGRNLALRASSADLVIAIDDDAYFASVDPVGQVVRRFADNPRLGLLAFQIVNDFSGEIQSKEFPCRAGLHDPQEEFAVSYFVGAGWAARREAMLAAGAFCAEFFFHQEELDLSCRLINRGWELWYTPAVVVRHKQALAGRQPAERTRCLQLRNRLLIGYRYFPLRYRLSAGVLWFLQIARLSRSLRIPLLAWREYLQIRGRFPRERLTAQALTYMRENGGRLFF